MKKEKERKRKRRRGKVSTWTGGAIAKIISGKTLAKYGKDWRPVKALEPVGRGAKCEEK